MPDDDRTVPVAGLFADVVGQADAIAQLRAAARQLVHAYLLVGTPGLGQRSLVRGFTAALLCPRGGCGECEVCRRALAGIHPDVVEVERAGALVSVDDARRVVRVAQRRPLEGPRQVIVVSDIHLARLAAPVLLKTLEEPAGQTVFVLLADTVPAELATVASRCVRIELHPLAAGTAPGLVDGNRDGGRARRGAGRSRRGQHRPGPALGRGRRLRGAPCVVAVRADAPRRHRGGGGIAGGGTARRRPRRRSSRCGPDITSRWRSSALTPSSAASARVPRRKEIEDRHHREERRWRTDELRAGFAVLAGAYRDRLVALGAPHAVPPAWSGRTEERVRELAGAITVVERSAAELIRNPNESLLLEAMLVRLSAVTG